MRISIILFCLAFVVSVTSYSQNDLAYGKIPIDSSRWYQLNNTSNGLGQLFDNDLTKNAQTGYGKILTNFDAWYPVLNGETINIDEIRFYDKYGTFTNQPLTVSIITDTWQRKNIATFTGERYDTWVGPYPNRTSAFHLDTPATNVKYIIINTWSNNYPAEIEFRGWYKAPDAIAPSQQKSVPLKNFFGTNVFEWNFLNNYNGYDIDESSMQTVKNFTCVRHYIDWEKLEQSEGSYSFNPTRTGGWNYDTIYQRCKKDGIEVLACIKQIPNWMKATYPQGQDNLDNVPVKYGKDITDPNSYIEKAKVAFQFAARYGYNKNVDPSLVSVNSVPRWTGDHVNQVKIGMSVIKYIECNNEEDKWWKGRNAYQTGREYAANLSAFYDGNMHTMGANAGVKNADSTMMVVVGGTASFTTDYVRGMIDWCKQYRGYKQDGTVNVCWDVINYHFYSNDAKSSQNGSATRGSAPEISGTPEAAKNFVAMAHQYLGDMPVWVTEAGYDINSNWSSQEAIAIGNKSVSQTQGDWILRTSLLYSRCGVQKLFFYKIYDDNINGGQFATCGLLNNDKSRRPAADFLYQVNKMFGNYSFKKTLNNDPIVDEYVQDCHKMYALMIPDENGRTADYNLFVDSANTVIVYTPLAGSDEMSVTTVACNNHIAALQVSETPIFVVPVYDVMQLCDTHVDSVISVTESKVALFPNPVQNMVTLKNLPCDGKTLIQIISVDGKIIQKVENSGCMYTWNVGNMPPGVYRVVITNKNFKTTIPLLKVNR